PPWRRVWAGRIGRSRAPLPRPWHRLRRASAHVSKPASPWWCRCGTVSPSMDRWSPVRRRSRSPRREWTGCPVSRGERCGPAWVYRGGAAVKTWLLAIAANVARHHVRSEVRKRALAAACANLPTRSPETPADAVERRQLADRLASALHGLDDDLAMAFVLCDV